MMPSGANSPSHSRIVRSDAAAGPWSRSTRPPCSACHARTRAVPRISGYVHTVIGAPTSTRDGSVSPKWYSRTSLPWRTATTVRVQSPARHGLNRARLASTTVPVRASSSSNPGIGATNSPARTSRPNATSTPPVARLSSR